jgi:hypothetical protein
MNTGFYDCRRKPDNCDPSELREIGDFNWRFIPVVEDGRVQGMQIVMPTGEQTWLPVVRGPAPADRAVWGWDGDLDRPTLEPSILDSAQVPKWHGYLRAGRLESC